MMAKYRENIHVYKVARYELSHDELFKLSFLPLQHITSHFKIVTVYVFIFSGQLQNHQHQSLMQHSHVIASWFTAAF